MGKIIVIGQNSQQDSFTLSVIAQWLEEQGKPDFARKIWAHETDVYDMATRPEKGDALDAINEHTDLVVALHLYGIDQVYAKQLKGARFYCRTNGHLLLTCMEKGIPVIVWGDQPWLGVEKKNRVLVTETPDLGIWYYENFHSPRVPRSRGVSA